MVGLVRCESYDREAVGEAVGRVLELLGGVHRFVKPGERVLIKPNLLSPAHPDRAITTHPSVVEAVIEQVKLAGGLPIIAESPGAGVRHDETN
ncbi:(4Fe-4S)-binding protein, partial [Candidatus Poribacteria bacterium]